MRKLLKRQCRVPRVMVTDKLAGYGTAKRAVMPSAEHRKHKGLNKAAENSHQPTRRRERQMGRSKSAGQAQSFLSAHDRTNNLFHLRQPQVPAVQHRAARTRAFQVWAEITGVTATGQPRARRPNRAPSRTQSNKLTMPMRVSTAINLIPTAIRPDTKVRRCGPGIIVACRWIAAGDGSGVVPRLSAAQEAGVADRAWPACGIRPPLPAATWHLFRRCCGRNAAPGR